MSPTTMIEQQPGRLGRLEFWAMNNPVRRLVQKYMEFRLFLRMLHVRGIDLTGRTIMDAGCGSGYGTSLIMRKFRPKQMHSFDLMPEQIERARRLVPGVDFSLGDLTRIETSDGSCDAAFIFGVLHHVPDWRTALGELSRVIADGGVLLVEEPRHGFTFREFEKGLASAGFEILERRALTPLYFRSWLCQKNPGGGLTPITY